MQQGEEEKLIPSYILHNLYTEQQYIDSTYFTNIS